MHLITLVFEQLRFEKLRTALTVVVVGAVIAVILVLEGMEQGLYAQLRQVIANRGADLILTQAGVSNMTAARSVIPQFVRGEVEALPGVMTAHPITQLQVIYTKDEVRTAVFLNVFDTAGGPPKITRGRNLEGDREIVIHESLADRHGLQPGDPFILSDFEFRIAGTVADSAAIFTPFAFVRYDDLLDFYFEADLAGDIATFPLLSFLLIELAPGASSEAVATAIEDAVPDVDVYTPQAMATQDENLVRALFGPVLQLLVGISYVIGVLVVGIFMFASIGRRLKQLAVLKALGFTQYHLLLTVLFEAAAITAVAVPVGAGLAALLAEGIHLAAPLYLVLPMETDSLLRTVVAAVAFALLGALAPLRTISRADPAEAFRS